MHVPVNRCSPADGKLCRQTPRRGGGRQWSRRCHGVTLLEIMLALLFLGLAVTPILQVFTQNYGLAGRRIDHELALKMAEATLNTVSAVSFSILNSPGSGNTLNLHFEVPGTPIPDVPLTLTPGSGNETAKGNASVKIARSEFQIRTSIVRIFQAAPLGTASPTPPFPFLKLTYKIRADEALVFPPATGSIDYFCPDDFLVLNVWVTFPSGKETKEISLSTVKANLNR